MEQNPIDLLGQIKTIQIISHAKEEKVLVILGEMIDNRKIILMYKKETFPLESDTLLENLKTKGNFRKYFENDIFSRFKVEMDWTEWNKTDLQIIFPANDKLIRKYTQENLILFRETPEIYSKITKNFIINEVKSTSSLQWIYNIFDKKSETEKILYEDQDNDNGFILVPDYSFDLKNSEELHIIALSRDKNIYCIRELNKKHLPLLKNILNYGTEVICSKFNIKYSELRIFVHYQPTYYHFHVHFTHISKKSQGFQCERAHCLSEVIQNIELEGSYYQKINMEYPLSLNSNLYQTLKENGCIV